MTIRIPKWLLAVLGVLVIAGLAVSAFLLGRSSDDEPSSTVATTSSTGAETAVETELPCDRQQARLVAGRGRFADEVFELEGVPPDQEVLDVYQEKLIGCEDLNGDGLDEMVVQLTCCTASSPAPWAIFEQEDERWNPAFIRTRVPAPFIKIEGDRIRERSPAFAPDEPLCCPSGRRQGEVSWDGKGYAYEPATGSTERTITVRGVTAEAIGPFKVQVGNLDDAIVAFGIPSDYLPDDELCAARWRDLGLTVNLVNFGGADPCGPEGAVGTAEISGLEAEHAGWELESGARVGDSQEELMELYPEMKPAPAGDQLATGGEGRPFTLVEQPTPFGDDGMTPTLTANLASGVAVGYDIYVGAGGE